MKEVTAILYEMCQRLGMMVDACKDGRNSDGNAFSAMFDRALASLDLRKAAFDYQELQGKLNSLQEELLDIQKKFKVPDLESNPAAS